MKKKIVGGSLSSEIAERRREWESSDPSEE